MRKGHSALSDLFQCVIAGGKNGFELYLKRGGNKNIQCSDGNSVMMHSIQAQDRELFDACINTGVNLNLANMKQETALHHAAASSNIYFLKTLLEHDLDLDVQNYKGNTPLMLSITKMQPESCMLLLSKDCNLSICNEDGNTALHLLILDNPDTGLLENPQYPLLKTFIEKGADWKISNFVFAGGCTPLLCAVYNKDMATVDKVLSCVNPDVFVKDLLRLFIYKNHCYTEVLLLKGVNPCMIIGNDTSAMYSIQSHGSLNELKCAIQNYSRATKTIGNEFLWYCFGPNLKELPEKFITHLVICGLQLTRLSSFIRVPANLQLLLLEFIDKTTNNYPVSLKMQCRTSIREYLGSSLQEKIYVLPVPKSVKKYLLFFDELNCMYSYNVNKYYRNKMILK